MQGKKLFALPDGAHLLDHILGPDDENEADQ